MGGRKEGLENGPQILWEWRWCRAGTSLEEAIERLRGAWQSRAEEDGSPEPAHRWSCSQGGNHALGDAPSCHSASCLWPWGAKQAEEPKLWADGLGHAPALLPTSHVSPQVRSPFQALLSPPWVASDHRSLSIPRGLLGSCI